MGHLLPHKHTLAHTGRRTHSAGTGWRGILENGMWMDGGTGAKQSTEERLQRERLRRRGRQVRSSRLIVLQAPPLRPGVSQLNKPLRYMTVPPTDF